MKISLDHLPEKLLQKYDDPMENTTSPPMMHKSTHYGTIYNPLIISMLGIIATSTAIVLYHMLLVKYCIRRHDSTATATQPAAASGIDERVLRTIPILTFSAVRRGSVDIRDGCVVCLGELEDEDEVRLLPNCQHALHVACIDQWFAAHASCPVCRSPIVEPMNVDPAVLAMRAANGSDCGSGEFSTTSVGEAPPRPPLTQSSPSSTRPKRSLSMDQSSVGMDLQNVNFSSPSSSACSGDTLRRSGSSDTRSNSSRFDRVSSMLRSSFSRLRAGKADHSIILPY
ncbi:Ring-H2 finger [Orobanche hederae]